ncbi:hypothetical protein [Siccirubricoccus sp. G192]|uniref:hypothetical protein n=1 Tax=Siccirubricoccus sp. G192 TaxID=2849651 RepID=UPI001C2BBF34|nr:hypothetical protein [Siccirubricoccus sp. G192]MBV1797851.1 hypothetical protein [Siccirubricoccus sp. G192]
MVHDHAARMLPEAGDLVADLKVLRVQGLASAVPVQPATDPPPGLDGLGRGWRILRKCRLGHGEGLPLALLHPSIGVALLDLLPGRTEGAVEALRARLDLARFPAIFPGHLPVVHLRLSPRELETLQGRLEAAFAAVPPLSLAGGDAWVGAVARALMTEPAVPRLQSRRLRRRGRSAGRHRLAGGAVLAAVGLAVLLAVAGGGRPTPPAAPATDATGMSASLPAAEAPAAPPGGQAEAPAPVAPQAVAPPLPRVQVEAPNSVMPPVEAVVPAPPRLVPVSPPRVQVEAPAPVASQAAPPPATQAEAPLPDSGPARISRPVELRPYVPPRRGAANEAAPRTTAPGLPPIAARRAAPAIEPEEATAKPPPAPPPRPAYPEASRRPALPPIAAPAPLPPIAMAQEPPPEPLGLRCRRIVQLVGQGVLLPEGELRFFQQACVRR